MIKKIGNIKGVPIVQGNPNEVKKGLFYYKYNKDHEENGIVWITKRSNTKSEDLENTLNLLKYHPLAFAVKFLSPFPNPEGQLIEFIHTDLSSTSITLQNGDYIYIIKKPVLSINKPVEDFYIQYYIQEIKHFPDTSKMKYMENLFNYPAITVLNISNLNTSNAVNMSEMFRGCHKLVSLDLKNFNTSKVTDMSGMFDDCRALTALDLSSFDTSNVEDMSRMFLDCESLESLDLSNFNTSNVKNTSSMFYNCKRLKTINLNSFDVSNVTNMGAMFRGCTGLTVLDLSNWNTSGINSMLNIIAGCNSLLTIRAYNADYEFLYILNLMKPSSCKLYISEDSEFNHETYPHTEGGTIQWTLKGSTNILLQNTILHTEDGTDTNVIHTYKYPFKITKLTNMFMGCSNVVTLSFLSDFDISATKYLANMFRNCASLTTLDLSNWDTSNVTSMNSMFLGCRSLVTLDLSNFDTSKVTSMRYVFSDCTFLTSLDLGNWDFSKVTDMTGIFDSCNNLTTIIGPITGISCDVDLTGCPYLNGNSISTIIDGLKDNVINKRITLKSRLYSVMSKDQKDRITNKGWTVVVAGY